MVFLSQGRRTLRASWQLTPHLERFRSILLCAALDLYYSIVAHLAVEGPVHLLGRGDEWDVGLYADEANLVAVIVAYGRTQRLRDGRYVVPG
jgi:hypothetical protein